MIKKNDFKIFATTGVCNLILLGITLKLMGSNGWSAGLGLQLVGLIIVGALVETAIVCLIHQRMTKGLLTLTKKVTRLNKDESTAPVLLKPNDDLYALAMALNQLQDHHQELLTSKKRQEAALVELLTYLPVGVMVLDSDRQVQLANAAMGHFLNTDISQDGHPFVQDVKSYDLSRLITQATTSHTTQQKTVVLQGINGPKTVEATVICPPENVTDFSTIVLLYDITAVTAVEKMQRDFLTNASHELKTPVTAITGFAETLLSGAKDDPETLTNFLAIIHRESLRLTDLIADVLSLSQLESIGVTDDQPGFLPLFEMVNEQFELMQAPAQANRVTLINQVPKTAQPVGNLKQITVILKNLLANAINYNRRDGQVTVSYEAGSDSWTLVVADTGVGIAMRDQKRVFERFYRANHSREENSVPGTGLGLAIVAETVALLDGQLDLVSQRGVGTTITVQFKRSPKT